jgi:putative oxidoreductase
MTPGTSALHGVTLQPRSSAIGLETRLPRNAIAATRVMIERPRNPQAKKFASHSSSFGERGDTRRLRATSPLCGTSLGQAWSLGGSAEPSHLREATPTKKGMVKMNITIIPLSWTPALLSLLRVMTALLFLEHGTGKIFSFPPLPPTPMPTAMLIGTGIVELIGGVLVLVGFLTRPTAFVLSGYMAVGYFMVHAPMGFFPVLNFGEMAIMFCFVFLYLAAVGAGPYSVDKS